MRWLRVFGIGLVSAIAGTSLAIYAGDLGSRAHHMSDFEGGRGMFLAFVVAPAGLIGGFLIGAAFGLKKGTGWGHTLRRLGLALVTVTVVAGAAGGLALISADHPPTIDGKPLSLEFEVKLPASSRDTLETLKSSGFTANLHATDTDNYFADLDFEHPKGGPDALVIGGAAALNSRSMERTLLVGPWPSQVFEIALPANPSEENFAWTNWRGPAHLADLAPVPAGTAYSVRYRVVFQ